MPSSTGTPTSAEISVPEGMAPQSGMNEVVGAKVGPGAVLSGAAVVRELLSVAMHAGATTESATSASVGATTRGRARTFIDRRRYPAGVALDDQKLPIKMLNDRVLVRIPDRDGERRSSGGILIPATAQISKRLTWAEVVAVGQNVRSAEIGDRVLFSPEDRYEVEVGGNDYIMLRERDIHAVAASRIETHTGLYL